MHDVYTCMYMQYAHIHIFMYIYTYTHLHQLNKRYAYTHVQECIHARMYVCMHISAYPSNVTTHSARKPATSQHTYTYIVP